MNANEEEWVRTLYGEAPDRVNERVLLMVVSQIGMGTTVTVELRGQICNGQRGTEAFR